MRVDLIKKIVKKFLNFKPAILLLPHIGGMIRNGCYISIDRYLHP